MGWRSRYDKEVNVVAGVIPHLMSNASGNPNSLAGLQHNGAAVHFHYSLTRQDVEKLLRTLVEVPNFCRSGRHALLNHTEFGVLQQMPAVTLGAPSVVLGSLPAD